MNDARRISDAILPRKDNAAQNGGHTCRELSRPRLPGAKSGYERERERPHPDAALGATVILVDNEALELKRKDKRQSRKQGRGEVYSRVNREQLDKLKEANA